MYNNKQTLKENIKFNEEYYNDPSEKISADIENNALLLSKGSSNFKIANLILLQKVGVNQTGQLISVAIDYVVDGNNVIEIPLTSIDNFKQKNIIQFFRNYGINIQQKYANKLANYIEYLYSNYELNENCEVISTYDQIGFLESIPGLTDFETYYTKFITTKDKISVGNLTGEYNPLIDYSGNIEDINAFLAENINTNETLLGLALGLLGPVSSMLGYVANVGNALVNISGRSSTGKSTIANLGVSLFSKPHKTNAGLYRNANGTTLSIERTLDCSVGTTLYVDDFSAFASTNSKHTEKLLYSLESEYGRTSCNHRGGIVKTPHRKGAIIFTSEKKLANENFKRGAIVRVLELADIPWTTSAEHSEKINIFCKNNYGLLGPRLIQYLLKYSTEQLNYYFNYHRNKFIDYLAELDCVDEFTPRISVLYSLIMICADIIRDYYIENVNIEPSFINEIRNNIFAILTKKEIEYFSFRNTFEDDYKNIVEFCKQNSKKFIHNRKGIEIDKNNFFGRITKNSLNQPTVILTSLGIKALMQKYEVDLSSQNLEFLEYLEENNLIKVNPDEEIASRRYKMPIPMNGGSFRCTCIYLPEDIKNHFVDL